MQDRFLTTGDVARLLGVTPGTVLRAVRRGEITPALHTPGGALRFRTGAVDRYTANLGIAPLDARREIDPSDDLPGGIHRFARTPADVPAAAAAAALQVHSEAGLTDAVRQLEIAGSGSLDTEAVVLDVLTLVADSLCAGMACIMADVKGRWQVAHVYDRIGLRLHLGDDAPFTPEYGAELGTGELAVLIVEDVHHDARAASWSLEHPEIGSYIGAPVTGSEGESYGVLCVLYSDARTITGGEAALVGLATRIIAVVLQNAGPSAQVIAASDE